ncbi:MAG: heterodisulfide reductase-related iron-sulfur binding cluster [Ilumatobacter sp.]|uniref:(Fe-S)-binding protein n=1 Tax=Ilumatobacter sp. TaxID=1967498 RepID=UPI0026101EC8|nr:heterodisulfide reductase-related iron-sulfur binding cluster [Ilumatobacter sp.]MDJ0767375.1 heterodisulfide reductase-related iron-sulfur binding cluster [Ilumatobacter sp.]
MDLQIGAADLNTCVQCGLCLPHCPTFRVTGDEAMSPRGRIGLMRAVQNDGAPVTGDVLDSLETCVQCRGCEPACPSGVPFGHMMEQARETLADRRRMTPRWQRLAFAPLTRPAVLRAGSTALALAQRARLVPRRFALPAELPVRRRPLPVSGDDVYLFTGCVMDAWQRDVHAAAQRVVEAAGFGVTPTGDRAPCCGALHAHAGLTATTRRLATTMMRELGGGDRDRRPILVDSAGCGAAMKEYGHLLGTPEAAAFSARVYDIHEWLAERLDLVPAVAPLDLSVAVQDPCHLRHVQRVHAATRTVLRPFVRELRELDDEGLCCGAGGAYSLLQPGLAGDIRDRKLAAVDRAGADVVASANPGCSIHLGAAGADAVHPMQLVDRALSQR